MSRRWPLLLALLLGGCGQSMEDQAKYEVYEAAGLFRDGKVNQDPVPGTVARGELAYRATLAERPALSLELIERGRERFDAFCSPCHSFTGDGNGMVVQRGFPRPPSFHSERLRDAPTDHFIDVITNGYGVMYSYAERVPPGAAAERPRRGREPAAGRRRPPGAGAVMLEHALPRLRRAGALAALLGIVLCAPFALSDPPAFWRAYLTAFVAWHTVPLGCLALLLTYHVAGGPWGRMLGEALEAGARTLPLVALFGLPSLFDLDALFPWARPDYLAHEELVRHKALYLDPPFFVARTLLCLALWAALAWLITDRRAPLALRPRRQGLAAAGAILLALSATFAAIDWSMSLDPRFNSATFGLIVIGGELNAGLSFAALITLAIARVDRRVDVLAEAPLVGLGGLLLAAILLWAYLAFMEYLVV